MSAADLEQLQADEPDDGGGKRPDGTHICKADGCEQIADSGPFGHTYCKPHWEQEKAAKATLRGGGSRGGGRGRSPGSTNLQAQIRDAMLGTAALASITDPRIFVAVSATVDEFAVAWDNVARHSPAARRYIEAMLSGGVWLGAATATLVMVITTLAVTDRLPPNLAGLGMFCLGRANIDPRDLPGGGGVPAVPVPPMPTSPAGAAAAAGNGFAPPAV